MYQIQKRFLNYQPNPSALALPPLHRLRWKKETLATAGDGVQSRRLRLLVKRLVTLLLVRRIGSCTIPYYVIYRRILSLETSKQFSVSEGWIWIQHLHHQHHCL